MKNRSMIFCAVVLLTACTVLFGQKTEVSVKKGKVIAETLTTSVTVEAGRKTVLLPGKDPIVTVDEPLVNDVMEMYKWAEAEKQEQRVKIDTFYIVVSKLDDQPACTYAEFNEIQNTNSEPKDTCMPPGWVHEDGTSDEDTRFYDLKGNLLRFDLVEKVNEGPNNRSWVSANYTLHYPKSVGPGEYFKYIGLGKDSKWAEGEGRSFWREGPLRHYIFGSWGGKNSLNYWRIILPKSVILVATNSIPTTIDSVDGRVALTFRSLWRDESDDSLPYQHIAYLWPDKDGTSIADLPPQYRGLRDPREEELVKEYRRTAEEISRGKVHTDQSTPVAALLSMYSARVHKDRDLGLTLTDPERRKNIGDVFYQLSVTLPSIELLGTPVLPTAPTEGQIHRVNLCKKGSLLEEAALAFVYRDGKWYFRHWWFGHIEEGSPMME